MLNFFLFRLLSHSQPIMFLPWGLQDFWAVRIGFFRYELTRSVHQFLIVYRNWLGSCVSRSCYSVVHLLLVAIKLSSIGFVFSSIEKWVTLSMIHTELFKHHNPSHLCHTDDYRGSMVASLCIETVHYVVHSSCESSVFKPSPKCLWLQEKWKGFRSYLIISIKFSSLLVHLYLAWTNKKWHLSCCFSKIHVSTPRAQLWQSTSSSLTFALILSSYKITSSCY